MYTVGVGLGSNLGRREENLKQAGERLGELVTGRRFSSLYESAPVGYPNQPWFLNQACMGVTVLPPLRLLFCLKDIEQEMGRAPAPRFGPRLIDLDLLFYSDWVMKSHLLTIPHPRLTERSFVLLPLLEIWPEGVHPETRESLREIWSARSETFSPCIRRSK